ncbi:MAG: hypothetical protein RL088_1332 [Verrucomicrobiota bacterium]|jgi:cytochrome bd-type quinol oxidase subunit 2
MNSPERSLPPERTWWIIWFALLSGPFVIFSVVPSPKSPDLANVMPWQIALVPLVVIGAIRWAILPKVRNGMQGFALFIAGLALGEIPSLLGVLLFPEMKRELFFLTTLAMAQFVPMFSRRFYSEK